MKVCFAASSGGHLEELSRLSSLVEPDDFVLTEKSSYETINWCKKVFYISKIDRKEMLFIPKFIHIFFRSFKLLIKEKPEAIVSTGALATVPICILGKIMRKKIIYIESFARVNNASMTGKLLYMFADLFIVQWEEMLKVYPRAVCGGGIG